ncbi:glycosyltransferase [Mucilaginibacter sp. AW1-3]
MVALSIIIPVYNKEQYVDECIQSVLNQTFTDFELILVNDGSTDQSGAKCNFYREADQRVMVIHQQNGGVSSARNTGIKNAHGNYIGFIDSDDTIAPDMYELLIKNALKYEADISVCRLQVIFPGKVLSPNQAAGPVVLGHDAALAACLKGDLDRSANNKIYKRSVVQHICFEGSIYEDILYTCKAFLEAQTTVFENVVKYNYLVRDNSTSMSVFNPKYIETIDVSTEMIKMVSINQPNCLPYAEAFDVVANISLLNLLLLNSDKQYAVYYDRVVNTLKKYAAFLKSTPLVGKKHKYAIKAFLFSPKLYTWGMYAYCRLTGADVIGRSKKSSDKQTAQSKLPTA